MKSGTYRLYLFNDSEVKYHRAFVKSKKEIIKTETITKFPILPPRFVEEASGKLAFIYEEESKEKRGFEIKIQHGGVNVIDVYCKE